MMPLPKIDKDLSHFRDNVFRVAKHTSALGYPNGTEPSCPRVDILKHMPMDGFIVGNAKASGRQRLVEALGSHVVFESVKFDLGPKSKSIFQDRRPRITVGIGDGVVKHGSSLLGVFLQECLAPLLGRQSLAIEFSKHAFGGRAEPNTFDGADLRENRTS